MMKEAINQAIGWKYMSVFPMIFKLLMLVNIKMEQKLVYGIFGIRLSLVMSKKKGLEVDRMMKEAISLEIGWRFLIVFPKILKSLMLVYIKMEANLIDGIYGFKRMMKKLKLEADNILMGLNLVNGWKNPMDLVIVLKQLGKVNIKKVKKLVSGISSMKCQRCKIILQSGHINNLCDQ
ncbi:unnamed protein product [Paramecium octaurelia]|uniref:Uncharacterized protein n=1 Tax=Paramecium octaurelia TaxID=43137 RepID=A0A8S1X085_PAROT|nr:unnamed protein product [Paramecium octaurelia]